MWFVTQLARGKAEIQTSLRFEPLSSAVGPLRTLVFGSLMGFCSQEKESRALSHELSFQESGKSMTGFLVEKDLNPFNPNISFYR